MTPPYCNLPPVGVEVAELVRDAVLDGEDKALEVAVEEALGTDTVVAAGLVAVERVDAAAEVLLVD